jgi:hypothetical protein
VLLKWSTLNTLVSHTCFCVFSLSSSALPLVALKEEGFIFLAISPGVVDTAEAPPPPEVMVEIQKQGACFAKVYPNWTGPIQPSESVGLMLGILDNLKPEDNGKFISHLGGKRWL